MRIWFLLSIFNRNFILADFSMVAFRNIIRFFYKFTILCSKRNSKIRLIDCLLTLLHIFNPMFISIIITTLIDFLTDF